MKTWSFFAFVLLATHVSALEPASGVIPVEDFARSPLYDDLQMSPDGQTLGFIREHDGDAALMFVDLKTLTARGGTAGKTPWIEATQQIAGFRWIGDRRVAFITRVWDIYTGGVTAIDCDFTNAKALTGIDARVQRSQLPLYASQIIYDRFDDENHSILMLDQGEGYGTDRVFPDVIKVDSEIGGYTTVVKNPGNVVGWGVDYDGVVRGGVTRNDKERNSNGGDDQKRYGLIYRTSAASPWQKVPPTPHHQERIRPIAFDPTAQKLYVAALSPNRRWSIYLFDPLTGALGDLVVGDPDYDVAPSDFGHSLFSRAVISWRSHRLLGLFYVTDGPRCLWLDETMAAYQKLVDERLPKKMNAIVSMTRDERKFLIYSFSDKEPGSYYLLDIGGKTLRPLVHARPWIKPEAMASMYPIKYTARDGQVIHAYFTMPNGSTQTNLPLVVMPHDGPGARDVWRYQPLVQLLASRGYAVLQMNYRGSIGYGDAFTRLARHQLGATVQNDIEDGARWAVAHHLADPKRVAILGGGFGGYSALWALGRNPGLFRCGISLDGISDWTGLLKGMTEPEKKGLRDHWITELGDPKEVGPQLQAMSPVNFADQITAPVLILHGKEDRVIPPKQSHEMVSALEKAGHEPDSFFVSNNGHVPFLEKARIEEYKKIESFLAKNMAP